MAKKVTMDDIAQATGFSKYAVSRALSGKSGVSEETRQKIVEASRQMGYVQRVIDARFNKHILVFAPRTAVGDESYWVRVLQGFETAAAERGFLVTLRTIEDSEDIAEAELLVKAAAGVVYAGDRASELVKHFKDRAPSILLGYPGEPLLAIDSLNASYDEEMDFLTGQMIAKGHRRIAYLGPTESMYGKALTQGIRRACKEHAEVQLVIWGDETPDSIQRGEEILRARFAEGPQPTLILCSTESDAQIVIFVLNKMGLRVPDDISVTGLNGDAESHSPLQITGMAFNKFDYGKAAFAFLYQRMCHPESPYLRVRVTQTFVSGVTVRSLP